MIPAWMARRKIPAWMDRMVRAGWLAAGCAALVLLTSCDPPGKPGAEEPDAVNREEIVDFKDLYGPNCAGCHGADGKYGPARILNDPLYLAFVPRQTLHGILENGRAGTGMPAWAKKRGGPLVDKQIDALTDGIYKAWSKPDALRGATPPSYAAVDGSGDARHGKQLFNRNCFMCHGKGARIGSVQEGSYLSLVTNQMLRTSIVVGRSDLGMPDYRYLNAGKPLSDSDVTDLVAYLASLRPIKATADTMGAGTGSQAPQAGQQAGPSGAHENENGLDQGRVTRGNEGSGNGPGSPRHENREGNKSQGSGSQQGVK